MGFKKPFAYATKTGDVVLAGVLDKYAIKTDPKSGESGKLREDYFNYGADNLKTPLHNPQALINLLELNTYHARCVDTKATDIGGLGVEIKATSDKPNEANKEKIQQFLDRCFPVVEEVFYRAAYDKQSIGYGCIELVRYGNLPDAEPERLEHIPAHTVRVHRDGNKYMHTWDNVTKRWFKRLGYDKDIDAETGDEYELGQLPAGKRRATELIFDINYSPKSTYYGSPDIIPAFKTLIGDMSAVEYNIYFFRNFGVPDYAIFITGDFEDEEIIDPTTKLPTGRSKMQEAIEAQMKKVIEQPHSTMVISIPTSDTATESAKVEVKFERLTVDVKESSFRLYRMDNRDEIITAHKTDPYRVGVLPVGSLGGNLGAETKKNYKATAVAPNQRLLEAYVNIYIVKAENGLNVPDYEIRLVTIDTADEAHDMLMCTQAVVNGGMTPNEFITKWQDKLGLKPVEHPAMNAHYLNGQPLDYMPEVAPATPEVVDALKGLQDYFIEVAEKYEFEEQGI